MITVLQGTPPPPSGVPAIGDAGTNDCFQDPTKDALCYCDPPTSSTRKDGCDAKENTSYISTRAPGVRALSRAARASAVEHRADCPNELNAGAEPWFRGVEACRGRVEA
eukprot:961910-Prymnesium_polylepis.1